MPDLAILRRAKGSGYWAPLLAQLFQYPAGGNRHRGPSVPRIISQGAAGSDYATGTACLRPAPAMVAGTIPSSV